MAVTAISAAVSWGVSSIVETAVVGAILEGGLITTAASWVGGSVLASGIGMVAGGIASSVVKGALTSNGGTTAAPTSTPQASLASTQAARGLLLNGAGNIEPIPVIYGARRVGGTRVFIGTSGSTNEYLHQIIVIGEGEIEAIDTVYLDGIASTDSKFSGLVTVEKYLGTDSQAACATLMSALPSLWTSNHRLAGVAYLYVRLQYNSDVFHSLPTITADVRGRKLYDPRNASTAYSTNPALAIRDYLTNTRYGRGVPSSVIDDATFSAEASYYEESVTIPGGTQARYSCSGVVNVDDAMIGTLTGLLTSCRGMLVFSGGKFKLITDRQKASSFAFTEDNIVGEWSVKLPGKREKMNRIRARFFNPSRDWQPDFAIQESTSYRSLDNGIILEQDVNLPFTSDLYRAQQIAQIELKQSRIGIVCQFTATIAATEVEVGDVVTITHATPGWSAKSFRVVAIELRQDDEVAITCREYDAGVYTLDSLTTWTPPASTTLPDLTAVEPPGAPLAAESLYQTSGSAGVKTRVDLTWLASPTANVVSYELQWQAYGSTTWFSVLLPNVTNYWFEDVAAGNYTARVRAVNAAGVTSAWASRTTEVYGLTAPPADITGFAVTKVGGLAFASWYLHPDLDVRIGGRIVIRHTPLTTGATWADGIIVEEFNGDTVTGTLPLMTGTYMAKAKDSTDHYSLNAVSFSVTEGMVSGWTTAFSSVQHPAFSGSKTNIAKVGSAIQLETASAVDDMTDALDAWTYIEAIGGISPSGSYSFDAVLDMTTVATRRFEADVRATAFDAADIIDSRLDLVDLWQSIDGDQINDCDATLFVATTDDNPSGTPTWTAWAPFFVGDFTCRAAKFRLDLTSSNATHNISVDQLRVDVKTPA